MQDLLNDLPLISAAMMGSSVGSSTRDITSQETTETQPEEYHLSEENSVNGEPPRWHWRRCVIVGLPLPKEMSKSKSLFYNEAKARNIEPEFSSYAFPGIEQVERQQATRMFCGGDALLRFLVKEAKYPYLLSSKGKRMRSKYVSLSVWHVGCLLHRTRNRNR